MSQLATHPERHIILVTATPHSGNEAAFRSLLGMLHADFANLPEDLWGRENEPHRRRLAAHFVQRRRADIRRYLDIDTVFPERQEAEETYRLSPDYKRLFERVLNYARETVSDTGGTLHRQRVRWWSALALLRSMASSPAAAAATLRTRAVETNTPEEADAHGRQSVLDLVEDDSAESPVQAATQEMLKDKIDQVLKTLAYREREIIKLRYGLGDGYTYTLEEVGRIFKVTRERVRQIEAKSLRKLQHPLRSRLLEGFMTGIPDPAAVQEPPVSGHD